MLKEARTARDSEKAEIAARAIAESQGRRYRPGDPMKPTPGTRRKGSEQRKRARVISNERRLALDGLTRDEIRKAIDEDGTT